MREPIDQMRHMCLVCRREWNPKLQPSQDFANAVSLLKANCPEKPLEGPLITQVGARELKKGQSGAITSSHTQTHWGRAIIFREDWDSKPGRLGAFWVDIRAMIAADTGHLYQVSWDAQNERAMPNCSPRKSRTAPPGILG